MKCALPALCGRVALAAPQPDVAKLQVDVAAEILVGLDGALIRLEGLVMAACPIVEISDVLVQLGNRWVFREALLTRGERLVVRATTLQKDSQIVVEGSRVRMTRDTLLENLLRACQVA